MYLDTGYTVIVKNIERLNNNVEILNDRSYYSCEKQLKTEQQFWNNELKK